ncbi:MAG: amidase [Chloroflexota bacterium]|nr:amidase [Chloroflexota bacterium]MDQ5866814.1 amidase [Chloroflexota bacterium]
MQDLTSLTATQLALAIREGRASSIEVLEAYQARIAERNPALNAIVTLDEEGARRRAAESDAALARGELRGPLHGVPMTLKDGHSTAGMRTTSGHPPLADYVPAKDGTVAARLKEAGAIITGKTNVSPRLRDIQSHNDLFGRTNNPYDLERTSGGSSGGAAAALAACMTPLEIGSDLAGSIRIPAHFCGVYGLKPTEYRVSMHGHIPDVPGVVRSHRNMWSIGPLARSVEDLELAFRIIAGPDGRDHAVPPIPLREVPDLVAGELRIAWAPTFPGVPVAGEIRQALHKVAAGLERAGAQVEEKLPGVDFGEIARTRTVLSEVMNYDEAPTQEVPSVPELYTALHRRDAIISAWEDFFGEWDALLCPVCMVTAFPHCPTNTPLEVEGETVNYWRAIGHTAPFNFTGHPVVVVPIGRDTAGLPIGIQVVGKRWDEERLLGISRVLEAMFPYESLPPSL